MPYEYTTSTLRGGGKTLFNQRGREKVDKYMYGMHKVLHRFVLIGYVTYELGVLSARY